jgi:hypothetical protein
MHVLLARGSRLVIKSVLASLAAVPTWSAALAHSAPSGWTYPQYCCANHDCREVAHDAISERPQGYVIRMTGEVVPYRDGRLKNSPDGEYHWCSAGGADTGRTICLFVPPRGF